MNAKFFRFRSAILSFIIIMTLADVSTALDVFELAETGTPSQLREAVENDNANFNVKISSPIDRIVIDAETGKELYTYKGKEYDITAFVEDFYVSPLFIAAAFNSHTDLAYAVINDNPEAVNILLDFNADPNTRDYLNKLALDYALELPKDSKLRRSRAFKRLQKLTKAKTGMGIKVNHKGELVSINAEQKIKIRERPETSSSIKSQLKGHNYIRIDKQFRDSNGELWYYIATADDVKGWVLKQEL